MSKIISIATGVPGHKHKQEEILSFMDKIYSRDETDSRKLKFLYAHGGISTRYSVIPDYCVPAQKREFYPPTDDLEPFPSVNQRMEWFDRHAAPLSVTTIEKCIEGKISKDQVTHLITVSCTGMSAPGLDLEIVEMMGLPSQIFRTSVNFMGCYAAIHGLKLADSLCKSDPKANVVVVCTELCTLHFQKEISQDNITSTLLFADGCAAVLLQHDNSSEKGIQLDNFFSDVVFRGKPDMSWKVSNSGFVMTLSGYLPDLVKEDFDALVTKALAKAGVNKNDITHWCIHPGGKKILEAIEKSVALEPGKLNHSYQVLNDYGNMSSASILFVLQRIFDELKASTAQEKATIFGAAFGPGLTMETFIASYD